MSTWNSAGMLSTAVVCLTGAYLNTSPSAANNNWYSSVTIGTSSVTTGASNVYAGGTGGAGGIGSAGAWGAPYTPPAPVKYRIDGKDMTSEEFDKWLEAHDEIVRGSVKADMPLDI